MIGSSGKAAKFLKDCGLKFSGEDRSEDPEQFLDKLNDCRSASTFTDAEIIAALPCVLSKTADRWLRTTRKDFKRWDIFEAAFKRRFIVEYDERDIENDLKIRTQGKGESITAYVQAVRYLASKLPKQKDPTDLARLAFKNLTPEYSKAVKDRVIMNLSELEEYGLQWERQKTYHNQWQPPPAPEKMCVPAAAFIPSASRALPGRVKAAAISDAESESEAIKGEWVEAKPVRKKKTAKKAASVSEKPTKSVKVEKANAKKTAPVSSAENTIAPRQAPQPVAEIPRRGDYIPRDRRYAYNANYQGGQGRWIGSQSTWGGRVSPRDGLPSPQRIQSPGVTSQGATYYNNSGGARPQNNYMGAQGVNGMRSGPFIGRNLGRRSPGAFMGPCFECQGVGHRASECPNARCFWCQATGHTLRNCPSRQRATPPGTCQICYVQGHEAKDCKVRYVQDTAPGNAQGGEQKQ